MEYVPNKNRWYPEHRDDFESIGAINVVLPVQIEQRLLNLEPGNPMRLMIEHLHANGVDAVYIQQYIDAAASLHADRPSRVGRSRDYNFLPPASYFRPELNFANHAAANWLSDPFPAGSILSRFKPRVTSFDQGALQIEEPPAYKAIMAEVQEVISSEDQRIVESLKDFFEQDPRLEESRDSLLRILNADGVDLRYNDVMDIINDQELAFDVLNQIDDIFLGNVAKGDIFLSRINRLMYSLHEPMHIVEAINYGDALIRIKERLNADELAVLNEEAEKEAIRRTELGLDNLGKEAEARRQKTWFFRTRKDDTGPSLHRSFVFENEALMDSLSQDCLHDFLLEKPVLLLNVHNRLHICVHLWKGLKKEYITTPVQNRQKIWAALKNMSQLLLASINHLELMYFSAFASPQEAEEYFRNRTQSEVSGDVVASQFFSHGELLNISLEMQSVIDAEIMLIEQDVYGEDVLLEADKKDYFLDTDIIIEAHRIIEFCVEGNISYDDLLLFLDGTDVVGFRLYSDLNEGVRAALSRILRLNNIEWRYPVQRFFRREVLKILQRMSPSLYAPSVQAPFYVAELMKSSVTVRAWVGFFDEGIEEIMQLQQIGIMKLEPGKLNASDQAEFIDAIHSFREGSLTLEDLIVLMTKLQARIGRVV